ncbi:MAG TPA: helix-turn-helix domain-containing protein [Acidiphilium rubrum]|jgi:excisionase family DNA binding protein|nr:helix-turn-helix domain-containing protein [Acidiphilium rubrum]
MHPGTFSRLNTRDDTAKRLGISARTLDRMVDRGEGPPTIRIGTRVLFSEEGLAEWVKARTETRTAA